MPRLSRYAELTHEQQVAVSSGKPFPVRATVIGKPVFVRSLRGLHRKAYDSHVAEISIGSEKTRVNVEELLQALRLV